MKYLKRYGITPDTSDYTPDAHEREYQMTAAQDPARDYSNDRECQFNFEIGGQSWINPANYHPAEVGAHDEWKGKTWRDMPGTDSDNKKLNFVLFRRGLYEIEDCQAAARRSISHHFRSAIIAGFIALSSMACAEEPQKRDFRPLLPKQESVGFREMKALPKRENSPKQEKIELPANPSEPESSLFPDELKPSFK